MGTANSHSKSYAFFYRHHSPTYTTELMCKQNRSNTPVGLNSSFSFSSPLPWCLSSSPFSSTWSGTLEAG